MKLDRRAVQPALANLGAILVAFPEAESVRLTCTITPGSSSHEVLCIDAEGLIVDSDDARLTDALDDPVSTLRAAVNATGALTPVTVEIELDRSRRVEVTSVTVDPHELTLRPLALRTPPAVPPEPDAGTLAELKELWRRDAPVRQNRPGANPAELETLAATLGHPVPGELAALLRLSNGTGAGTRSGRASYGWQLLSTAEIALHHTTWVQLAADGPYTGVAFDLGSSALLQPRLLHPGWIPFARDGAGAQLAVDLVPGPAGVAGQIIEFGPDLHRGPFRIADSLVDLLAGRRHSRPATPMIEHTVRSSSREPLRPSLIPADVQALRLFDLGQTDISELAGRPIRSLIIGGTFPLELAGITSLPLQELHLLDMAEEDLGPLRGHPTLRTLTLRNISSILHPEVLSTLPCLEVVESDSPAVLDVLAPLPRLHRVTLPRRRERRLREVVALANRVLVDAPIQATTTVGRG